MSQRRDRSRSPKRVGGKLETAWPGIRSSLDRVHEAVCALLSKDEAEADYLSNTQRDQLKQHLDRIAEDALKLAQPNEHDEDEMISEPAQIDVVNLNRTKSQAIRQKRIQEVRSQFNECEVSMTDLVRSVSQLIKDPVPSDVRQLREARTNVERDQKRARNYGEDLLQFMLKLDDISGLLDEDRNCRRRTMRGIDALLAKIDEAKGRLDILHRMLDKELENRQAQESLSFQDIEGLRGAEVNSSCRRGEKASEEPQYNDALRLLQEAKPEVPKMDDHPALLETSSLKRSNAEFTGSKNAPEHQVPMSRLARSASLIQEIDTLLSNIKKAKTEPMHQETVAAECAKVGWEDDTARLRPQEEVVELPVATTGDTANQEGEGEALVPDNQAAATEDVKLLVTTTGNAANQEDEDVPVVLERREQAAEEKHIEAVGNTLPSTQPPLLVPSGPPRTFAPRRAESYAKMAF